METVHNVDFKYLSGSFEIYGSTNEYTGSLPSKDGSKGVFANFFRYRVSLITDTEDKNHDITAILAQWYFDPRAFREVNSSDPEKITSAEFEASEEGAAEAVKWLQKAYDEAEF